MTVEDTRAALLSLLCDKILINLHIWSEFDKTFTRVATVLESLETIATLVNYAYKSFIKFTLALDQRRNIAAYVNLEVEDVEERSLLNRHFRAHLNCFTLPP